jgi:hypothetical protein
LTQHNYPAPPPPPPPTSSGVPKGGFHGPKTNFFLGIRRALTALETPPTFQSPAEPKRLFLVALLVSLPLGVAYAAVMSYGIMNAVGQDAGGILNGFLPMFFTVPVQFLLAVLLWGSVPNRRYGAAMGMLFGLGFRLGAEILWATPFMFPWSALRILAIPLIHPVAVALEGIGIFVLLTRKQVTGSFTKALMGLPLLFFFFSFLDLLSFAFMSLNAVPAEASYIISYLILIPIFAVILRDLLGGHFNFQHFLDPTPEPNVTSEIHPVLPPPPPLPPPP